MNIKKKLFVFILFFVCSFLLACGRSEKNNKNNHEATVDNTVDQTLLIKESDNELVYDIREIENVKPFANKSSIATIKNISVSGLLDGTDQDGDKLGFEVVTPPENGMISLEKTTGAFTYSPNADFTGQDNFTFRVSDGLYNSDETQIEITVSEPTQINTTDVTPPSKPAIVSQYSNSADGITLFWIVATDETTSAEKMIYEIHASTSKDFIPSLKTQKKALKGAVEAKISALLPSTTYYLKIVAIDEGGNRISSDEKSAATSAVAAKTTSASIITIRDLNLDHAEVENDSIVFTNIKKSRIPKIDQILIGNSENSFLRKVKSVDVEGESLKVETTDAKIVDLFESMELTSKTTLFDMDSVLAASGKTGYKKVRMYKPGVVPQTKIIWPSNGFSVISENPDKTEKENQNLRIVQTASSISGQ